MTPERQLGFLWGGVAVLLVAMSSWAEAVIETLPACPIKALFGLPCPGCGTARAALALARFDVVAAFAINPLATALWSLLVAGGLLALALALVNRSPREPDWRRTVAATRWLTLLLLANWAYLIGAGV